MKNLTLQEYIPDTHSQQWDDFIKQNSRNGGIFHERNFIGYHPPERWNDASLLFYDDKELLGVFPAAYIQQDDKLKAISHPGSSNGGLVFQYDCGLSDVLQMLEMAIEYYKERDISTIEMKIAEPIFNRISDTELTYLLWHRGFQIKTQELSSCIDVSKAGSWEKLGRKRNASYVRKFEREGFVVREEDDIEKVYKVIEENLKNKYDKKPTHTLEELKIIKQKYPERIHGWVAETNGNIAAAVVLFDVNEFAVHDFYIARSEHFSNDHVLPFLFYKLFDHYHQKGFEWFNLGISSREELIKWGILGFKENVGGRATARQVWELPDVKTYKKYTSAQPD